MKKVLLICLFSIFLTNCGFEVVNRSQLSNFDIQSIEATGDNRINFKIKNKIKFNSQENVPNLITIKLNTKKNKTIKEKNIKNEITKYLIKINVDVEFKKINNNKWNRFSVSKFGDYDVSSQYSQTLNNEKNLTEILTDKLSTEILDELGIRLNAN